MIKWFVVIFILILSCVNVKMVLGGAPPEEVVGQDDTAVIEKINEHYESFLKQLDKELSDTTPKREEVSVKDLLSRQTEEAKQTFKSLFQAAEIAAKEKKIYTDGRGRVVTQEVDSEKRGVKEAAIRGRGQFSLRNLSETEVLKLREKAMRLKKAKEGDVTRNGKIKSVVLSRDQVLPLRLAVGYVTVIRVLDTDLDANEVLIGDAEKFIVNVYRPTKDNKDVSTIVIKPKLPFVATNLIVFNDETPYFFNLIETYDEQEIDYVVDVGLSETEHSIDAFIEAMVYDEENDYTRAIGWTKRPYEFEVVDVDADTVVSVVDGEIITTNIGLKGAVVYDPDRRLNQTNADYTTRAGDYLYLVYESDKPMRFILVPEYIEVELR